MNYFEKWNLTSDEWEFISLLPYYVSWSVATADDVINREEVAPYHTFMQLMSSNKDECAIEDICKVSLDRVERNISEWELFLTFLNNYNLLDEEGSFNRKVLAVDHFLNILNLFDDHNKDKIKEYIFHLGLSTAYSYGVPENPMDESEAQALRELFRWLEVDTDKYNVQKNRDNFYAYLNGEI